MNNLAGWLFFLAGFMAFYTLLPRSERSVLLVAAGFLVILAHHGLSYINIAYGPLIFAKYDAWGFHLFAQKFAGEAEQLEWAMGTPMYKSIMLVLYDWFGKSLWLGQSISIFCFALSVGVLVRLLCLVQINNMVILSGVVLLYGLTPSGLLYGSITLREPWMTLFFILGCYWAVWGIQQRSGAIVLMACFSWLLMGLFHQVMMIYGFFAATGLILLYFVLSYAGRVKSARGLAPGYVLLLPFVVVIAGVALFYLMPSTGGDDYFAMIFDSVPQSLALYRGAGESSSPTTAYATVFSFKDWSTMLFSVSHSYFYYMSWPVTGDYRSMSTPVLMVGGILRLLGITCVVWLLIKDKHPERMLWWILWGLYFSMSFLWNIGTTNHGQALRHHMMTDWVLIASIGYLLQLWWLGGSLDWIRAMPGMGKIETVLGWLAGEKK